jgi:hypothetical protein
MTPVKPALGRQDHFTENLYRLAGEAIPPVGDITFTKVGVQPVAISRLQKKYGNVEAVVFAGSAGPILSIFEPLEQSLKSVHVGFPVPKGPPFGKTANRN